MINHQTSTITFDIAKTDAQLEEILALQRKNHYSSLTAAQQEGSGFVFAEHDMKLLKLMSAHLPQVLALSEGRVVGYNLAMDSSMEHELPSLSPMFEEFKKWNYEGKPLMDYQFIVGGQVCVDEEFRGQGLMHKLYKETMERAGERYQLCITEISTRNLTSLKAHQKLGFEVLGVYHDGLENWNLVVWNFKR